MGAVADESADIAADTWADCIPYLRGLDLFNHGYYWESHEVWESIWLAAGRTGRNADFIKSLIKLAAALVKAREGRVEGVRRHALRAAQLLKSVSQATSEPHLMGLSLAELIRLAESIAESPMQLLEKGIDERVIRLLDLELVPIGFMGSGFKGSQPIPVPNRAGDTDART
jgi:predicted metal-dependent hydrolase